MTQKHPGGRPPKYNAQFHPLLAESLARNGLIDKEIAEKLEISESTLHKWKLDFKEFSESIKRGKESVDDQVENALLKRALGFKEPAVKLFSFQGTIIKGDYDEYFPPDVAAAFIWLKNRRPDKWKDRREITGKDGNSIIIQIADYAADDQ